MTILDPARIRYAEYFDWYEDELRSLFTVQGTLVNGIGILGHANLTTRFNYFSAISRFFQAAALTDLPELEGSTYRAIEHACRHWSVTGEAFIIRNNAGLGAIRPDYVFPVSSVYNREQVLRYLIVYPERDPQQTSDFTNQAQSSDRAQVFDYEVETGVTTLNFRRYHPGDLGEDLTERQLVDIGRIEWVRSGEPPYKPIESIVREIIVRMNMTQLALNTTAVPLLQVDKSTLQDGAFVTQQLTLETFQRQISSPLGLTIQPPFGNEAEARYVERSGVGLQEAMAYVESLIHQLSVITGLPDYVFRASTASTSREQERVLFAGQARVASFRRGLEEALSRLGTTVRFTSEPFTTKAERLDTVVKQLAAGIISVDEARAAFGYPPGAPAVAPQPIPAPQE